ncbi:MAG: T9SS type A sorting domain-containing protein [Bacteroidetes bacterium]|nr:T9SS type A sorting domain-containing protein [Bacteroidota bacterium]
MIYPLRAKPILDPFGGTGWPNQWGSIPLANRAIGVPNSNNPIFWYHTGTNTSTLSPSQTLTPSVRPFSGQTNGITCQSPPLRIIHRDIVYGPIVGDSASYADYLSANDYQAKKRLYEKLNADTTLLTTGFGTDSAFVAFYNSAKTSNLELLSIPEKKLGVLSVDSLISLNNSIIDTNEIETNKKTVNSIRLNSIADTTDYSSTDTTALTDIAWQKAITGGDAVFSAREMLFLEIHEEIPALRLSGNTEQENLIVPISLFNNNFSIYPNPSHQYITIVKNRQLEIKRLEILDVMGKKVYETTTQFQSVDVSWLEEGLYYVRIIDVNENPWYTSFVKIQ